MKAQHPHTKLPWQKLMLRQVKWGGVRYGPITKKWTFDTDHFFFS